MKNENAISPVIGVILIIVITVILAAVIAVFVFSMADIKPTQESPDHITLLIKERAVDEDYGFYVISNKGETFFIDFKEVKTIEPLEFYDCEIKYDYWVKSHIFIHSGYYDKRITNCKIIETVTNV